MMQHTPTKAKPVKPTGPATRASGRASSLGEEAGPSGVSDGPGEGGVRKSIGEWEAGRRKSTSPLQKTFTKDVPRQQVSAASLEKMPASVGVDSNTVVPATKPKPRLASGSKEASSLADARAGESCSPPTGFKYADRVAEARVCLQRVKSNLGRSGNIKREIKSEVQDAANRLYQLVKEADAAKGRARTPVTPVKEISTEIRQNIDQGLILQKLEENTKLLQESNTRIEALTKIVEEQKDKESRGTYANVVANRRQPSQTALHSVVVTGEDEQETGDQVLERIRKAVKAKEGEITVEKIRKTKDRKIIIGCKTVEERQKVKEKIAKAGQNLRVEDIQNKNPLVILRDVLKYNSDEEVMSALRTQNKEIFRGLMGAQTECEIAYKKPARNHLAHHIVLRVAPHLWQRMVEEEAVHIDLQRVRVADQSPLVQCSLCLGYGHGRRFCKDTLEKCSHCGGPHMKADCADWLADATPSCCNCVRAKLSDTAHNAFSQQCAVRRRWDALARAKIAYC